MNDLNSRPYFTLYEPIILILFSYFFFDLRYRGMRINFGDETGDMNIYAGVDVPNHIANIG